MFFTHHCFIDKIFWDWQQADPTRRFEDFSGPIVGSDYDNLAGPNATLHTLIHLEPLAGLRMVESVMDTTKAGLCYGY